MPPARRKLALIVTDAGHDPALTAMLRLTGYQDMWVESAGHARALLQDVIPALTIIGALEALDDIPALLEELSRTCPRAVVAPLVAEDSAVLLAQRLGLLTGEELEA